MNYVDGVYYNKTKDEDNRTSTGNSDFLHLEARPHSPAATPYQQQVFPPASDTSVKARGTNENQVVGTRPQVAASRGATSRSGLWRLQGPVELMFVSSLPIL